MLARKVTHKVRVCMAARMIMPTSGPLRVHVGAIWLWPGCLLGVWVANLPWMPVASSRVNQVLVSVPDPNQPSADRFQYHVILQAIHAMD